VHGFRPDVGWIDLPVFGQDGLPVHHRGVVEGEPGLFFLYGLTSSLLGGVGRDAGHIAEQIAEQIAARQRVQGTRAPLHRSLLQ
jgi:putative flavoprotein involved in K+ transport